MTVFRSKQNGLQPTPAGSLFYNGITELAAKYQDLLRQTKETGSGTRGTLVLCVLNGAVIHEPLMERIRKFRCAHPNVEVKLLGSSFKVLEANLLKGVCDVSLMMANIIQARSCSPHRPSILWTVTWRFRLPWALIIIGSMVWMN